MRKIVMGMRDPRPDIAGGKIPPGRLWFCESMSKKLLTQIHQYFRTLRLNGIYFEGPWWALFLRIYEFDAI